MLKVKLLPAGHGDCIFINYGDQTNERHIMIDGGIGREAFRTLKEEVLEIKSGGHVIDLMVVTHIDDDHISGILGLFSDKEFDSKLIKQVWFNSGTTINRFLEIKSETIHTREVPLSITDDRRMSVKQGITLENALHEQGIWNETIIMRLMQTNIHEAHITVLSPTQDGLRKLNDEWTVETDDRRKMAANGMDYHFSVEELWKRAQMEDTSIPNMSSIAFLLTVYEKKILMLGDAHPNVVAQSLRDLGYNENSKLRVDLLKLSHHASKGNTSEELLQLISCNNFVISTNGARHGLPHKECLARVIKHCVGPINFYLNYEIPGIFTEKELTSHQVYLHSLKQVEYTIELEV